MRGRALAVATVGGVLAVIVAVGASDARRKETFLVPAYSKFSLRAKSSHGYAVSVSAEPTSLESGKTPGKPETAKVERPSVKLRMRRGAAYADYTVPARIHRNRFRARFGNLGEISLHIASAGQARPTVASQFCDREKGATQRVVFKGRFRFRGEQGFTRLSLHHVRGSVTRIARQTCSFTFPSNGGGHGATPFGRPTILEADTRSIPEVDFSAATATGISTAFFWADRAEIHGPMVVIRTVSARGPKAETFSVDPALTGATVTPPAPFSGQATYVAAGGEGSASWSGSLAADFPGRPDIPLAGAGFSVTLSHHLSLSGVSLSNQPQSGLSRSGAGPLHP